MYFDLRIWLGLVLFRIDVGLFCFLGLLCNHFFFFFRFFVAIFFFFKDFSSKFVCHKNFEGVPFFFLMGKQIIKFKFLYI